jgi:hypothetical protein
LNGLQKRELSLPPSRVHGHRCLHKRYLEPEAVKELIGHDVAVENIEDRRKIVHETLDGLLYSLIDWWFKPGENPKSTPTSTPQKATTLPIAQPIASYSAIPKSGITTGEFSRIGYYDSSTQHLDGLTFLGNHGGDGSGVFDELV